MVLYLISGDIFRNLITTDVEEDGGEDEGVAEDEVYFHSGYQVSGLRYQVLDG